MDALLGLDTSCYTTSAAAVDMQGKVIAFSRMLLPVESGQRGLRQSEAVFAHVRQIPEVIKNLMEQMPADANIVGVCASDAPRDEEGSYMPVFRVGSGYGQALADTLRVPFFTTSHQQGHIAAGRIGLETMDERFIALHISGGTTEMVLWENGSVRVVGGSLDLHAGQMVDRIGVELGLKFPAGPALEQLANGWESPTEALFSANMEQEDCYCHLSGAETKALRMIQAGNIPSEQIAAEVYDLLARTVSRMIYAGAKKYGVKQALVVGGVASSQRLRTLVRQRLGKMRNKPELLFGQSRYSADNAAGVACIGLEKYIKTKSV